MKRRRDHDIPQLDTFIIPRTDKVGCSLPLDSRDLKPLMRLLGPPVPQDATLQFCPGGGVDDTDCAGLVTSDDEGAVFSEFSAEDGVAETIEADGVFVEAGGGVVEVDFDRGTEEQGVGV